MYAFLQFQQIVKSTLNHQFLLAYRLVTASYALTETVSDVVNVNSTSSQVHTHSFHTLKKNIDTSLLSAPTYHLRLIRLLVFMVNRLIVAVCFDASAVMTVCWAYPSSSSSLLTSITASLARLLATSSSIDSVSSSEYARKRHYNLKNSIISIIDRFCENKINVKSISTSTIIFRLRQFFAWGRFYCIFHCIISMTIQITKLAGN